ncbi:MAG: prolipoprotein diacylglyceryl transferase [Sideroxyarcus sp.]|nr:prolipoprotein diacylglyceryl transferase [Sideroxyarcus sp.]
MKPILFNIIPAFFFMIMIATFVATYAAVKFAERDKLSVVVVLDLAIIAVVASMLGARIFHVLVEAPDYYGIYPLDPSLFVRVFYFWQGGFVSLGAFLATIGSWIVYLRLRKQPVLAYFDNMARVCPIVIFFVRVGCLLAGCCYGKPTDFFIHLIFTDPSSTAYHYYPMMPLHASQPYFMLNAIVMFFVVRWAHMRREFYGQALSAFLMYEGFSRFCLEFLRGDADRGIYFNGAISTGQVVMAGFFLVGLAMYQWCKKRCPIS